MSRKKNPLDDDHYGGNDEQIEDLKCLVYELGGILEKIVTVLTDHPEVNTGNTKVHYVYQKAKGGAGKVKEP